MHLRSFPPNNVRSVASLACLMLTVLCIPASAYEVSPPNSTIPSVIVGSPSGQARPYTVTLRNTSNVVVQSVTEIWLGYNVEAGTACDVHTWPVAYTADDPAADILECFNPHHPAIDWIYNEKAGNPVTFHPRFGGRGTGSGAGAVERSLDVQYELSSAPYYLGVACVTARSTDLDADGDTDQYDKLEIGQALASGSPPPWFNLNTEDVGNTTIDRDDYLVIVNEMLLGVVNTCFCPSDPSDEDPVCDHEPGFAEDHVAPDTTSLFVGSQSGSDMILKWRSPGDDLDGTTKLGVPKEYDLRHSSSPINSGNFGSATPYSSTPSAPALAGAMESVTITGGCSGDRYWAIKTKDWSGNWSAVSACLDLQDVAAVQTMTACAASKNCVLVGWEQAGTYTDLRYSTSNITEGNFYSASAAGAPTSSGGISQKFVTSLAQGTTYYFAVKVRAKGCWSPISNVASMTTLTTGTSCNQNVACTGDWYSRYVLPASDKLELSNPNPSPTGSNTTIAYSIPEGRSDRKITLTVFSVTGRKVATLLDGSSKPGRASVSWNLKDDRGREVGTGVYFVRLTVGDEHLLRRVIVDSR